MIKLYGGGPSRWVRPYWTLREMGIRFEPVNVFADAEEMKGLSLINPHRKVPVLVDDDFVLTESAAIVNYLTEKYPEHELAPKQGTYDRARYDQWNSFITTDLEQPLWRILRHKLLYPEGKRIGADIELAKEDFRKLANVANDKVTEYLVGDKFGAADINMAYTLNWANWDNLLDGFDNLKEYCKKHTSRPAFPQELYENLPV